MPYPRDALGMRLEVAPRADFTTHPDTYPWQDITRDLQLSQPITHKRGTDDEEAESNSESTFALKSLTGRYVTDNALSDLWPDFAENVPLRFSTNTGDGTGWHQEWVQYLGDAVDDWPGGTPNLCNTYITCNGLFRRLGQGDSLRSPLFRSMSGTSAGDYVPYAYWPMEDGSESTFFASGLASGRPASVSGTVSFASDIGLQGSSPLPSLAAGSVVSAAVPAYADTDLWVVQVALKIDSEPAATTTILEVDTPGGSSARWKLTIEPGAPGFVQWAGYDSAGAGTASEASVTLDSSIPGNPSESDFYGRWFFYTVSSWVTAPNEVAATLSMTDDGDFVSTAIGTDNPATHAAATSLRLYGHTGVAAGHWAVFTDPAFDVTADAFLNSAAMHGYAGESAVDRLTRLCREAGIPFESTATISAAMGPQLIDTLLTNFRNCEVTDHGMLDDSQGVVGYTALSEFYNQNPALVIDGAVSNRLFMPFNPTTDDQQRRNRVTATRTGGSSHTHENLDDINGVPGLRPGVGVFDGDIEVNIEADTDLLLHASHAVALGTIVGKRYPSLTVDLRRAPDLIPGYRNLHLAGRATIINPPRQHNRAPVDLLLPGWNVVINGRRGAWVLTANCTRYDPYIAGITGDASTTAAWFQCDNTSVLATELAPGGTSVSVTAVPLFTTSADLVTHPLSLIIGGEIMAVSAISGASNPQTFTVARSLNKRHPIGTPVQVHRPLLLVL